MYATYIYMYIYIYIYVYIYICIILYRYIIWIYICYVYVYTDLFRSFCWRFKRVDPCLPRAEVIGRDHPLSEVKQGRKDRFYQGQLEISEAFT